MYIGTLGMQAGNTPYKEIRMTFKSEADFLTLVLALRSGQCDVDTPDQF